MGVLFVKSLAVEVARGREESEGGKECEGREQCFSVPTASECKKFKQISL